MYIFYFDRWIIFKIFSQLGHVNIHTTGREIIAGSPDLIQGLITL